MIQDTQNKSNHINKYKYNFFFSRDNPSRAYRVYTGAGYGNAMSFTLIRQLVITGKIAHIRSGKKHLVDVNDLIRYLHDELTPQEDQAT